MCRLSVSSWFLLVIIVPLVYASQGHDGIRKCLEKGSGECLENVAENILDNVQLPDKLEVLPGVSLIRSNRTARGLLDISNRTISLDIDGFADQIAGKDARSRRRKQRRVIVALLLTAVLAAKASAVATSAALMIPLALVGLSLVATKALIIGKIAVLIAGVFGFFKFYGGAHHQDRNDVFIDQHNDRLSDTMFQAFPHKKKDYSKPTEQPYLMYRKH